MDQLVSSLVILLSLLESTPAVLTYSDDSYDSSVLVVLLARNKAHTLPFFLSNLGKMSYPKSSIGLFVRSDHNEDSTIEILEIWLAANRNDYHSADVILDRKSPEFYEDETDRFVLTKMKYDNIVRLKTEAMEHARTKDFNYVWFVDVDVFHMNPNILQDLVSKEKVIVAPLLRVGPKTYYSNFWAGMTDEYWYERTPKYLPIVKKEVEGCFSVPMVHSCFLVNLRKPISQNLTFNSELVPQYSGPLDDVIAFAVNANRKEVEMHICNDIGDGFFPEPLNEDDDPLLEVKRFEKMKFNIYQMDYPHLEVNSELEKFVSPLPEKDNMGFQKVFYINLYRRPDRKKAILYYFDKIGIDASRFSAVDGERLTDSFLKTNGIRQLENFSEYYEERSLKFGEVGCFLSHYLIWKEIVDNGYSEVLIIEDDADFNPSFRNDLVDAKERIAETGLEWDLIYLGRKKMSRSEEEKVDGVPNLVKAGFSFWTIGYALTLEGARKLLEPNPLTKLMPVDEYLPVMYDQHPEEEYNLHFPNRNLRAYAFRPSILSPTHYTGENQYITDTEDSPLIDLEEAFESSLERPSVLERSEDERISIGKLHLGNTEL